MIRTSLARGSLVASHRILPKVPTSFFSSSAINHKFMKRRRKTKRDIPKKVSNSIIDTYSLSSTNSKQQNISMSLENQVFGLTQFIDFFLGLNKEMDPDEGIPKGSNEKFSDHGIIRKMRERDLDNAEKSLTDLFSSLFMRDAIPISFENSNKQEMLTRFDNLFLKFYTTDLKPKIRIEVLNSMLIRGLFYNNHSFATMQKALLETAKKGVEFDTNTWNIIFLSSFRLQNVKHAEELIDNQLTEKNQEDDLKLNELKSKLKEIGKEYPNKITTAMTFGGMNLVNTLNFANRIDYYNRGVYQNLTTHELLDYIAGRFYATVKPSQTIKDLLRPMTNFIGLYDYKPSFEVLSQCLDRVSERSTTPAYTLALGKYFREKFQPHYFAPLSFALLKHMTRLPYFENWDLICKLIYQEARRNHRNAPDEYKDKPVNTGLFREINLIARQAGNNPHFDVMTDYTDYELHRLGENSIDLHLANLRWDPHMSPLLTLQDERKSPEFIEAEDQLGFNDTIKASEGTFSEAVLAKDIEPEERSSQSGVTKRRRVSWDNSQLLEWSLNTYATDRSRFEELANVRPKGTKQVEKEFGKASAKDSGSSSEFFNSNVDSPWLNVLPNSDSAKEAEPRNTQVHEEIGTKLPEPA